MEYNNSFFFRNGGSDFGADQYGHQLFFFPEYVAFDNIGETLYVTDRYKKSVISVTVRGEKRWEAKHHAMKAPRGITSHGTRVYIAGSRSHNILAMSTIGEVLHLYLIVYNSFF
jgi:hypothetical protein